MAGPLIGGRRPISWRLAIVVAFVAAYATARWLEGIFGAGDISGTVSFLVLVGLIAATWRINSRAANRQSELLGSARFGLRADVRKLEESGDLLIGRSAKSGKLLRYDGAAHLLTMAPILQDMHQLRANYGDKAGTFMSNAGVLQAFGVNDHATAELLSKTIGQTTLEYATPGTSAKTNPFKPADRSRSTSTHVTARSLMTPDEIMRMPPGSQLLLLQGQDPLLVDKIRYYDGREFAGLADPA